MNPESVIELMGHVCKLKEIRRTGWVMRGVDGAESVAGHSMGAALLAQILAPDEGADPARAVLMALVHDLPESIVGDLVPSDPSYGVKEWKERQAAEAIFREAPELLEVWLDFAEGKSPEARVVRQADKLDMLIQARRYGDAGFDVSDFFEREYEFTGLAKEISESLVD